MSQGAPVFACACGEESLHLNVINDTLKKDLYNNKPPKQGTV